MKEEIKDLRRRIAEDKKKIEQLNKITVQDSVACGKKGNKPLRNSENNRIPNKENMKNVSFYLKSALQSCRCWRRIFWRNRYR